MDQDQFIALEMEAFETSEKAHSDEIGAQGSFLCDRGLHVSDHDASDSHPAQLDRRQASDAVG